MYINSLIHCILSVVELFNEGKIFTSDTCSFCKTCLSKEQPHKWGTESSEIPSVALYQRVM